jgi:hypothetical protein
MANRGLFIRRLQISFLANQRESKKIVQHVAVQLPEKYIFVIWKILL